jgi:hypothetical protein
MLCYSCTLSGGGDLTGFFYLELIFFALLMLLIDFMIPKIASILIVNIMEGLLFIVAIYFLTTR